MLLTFQFIGFGWRAELAICDCCSFFFYIASMLIVWVWLCKAIIILLFSFSFPADCNHAHRKASAKQSRILAHSSQVGSASSAEVIFHETHFKLFQIDSNGKMTHKCSCFIPLKKKQNRIETEKRVSNWEF